MDSQPLVSIICLCYNQKKYVGAAIRSALAQTYAHIELIVVDDGSSDGSKEEIYKELYGKSIEFIDIPENIGNCAAFNKGLARSSGEYILDLAADDLLLPMRVEIGLQDFAAAGPKAGVHFSDAFIVDEEGQPLGTHYSRDKDGKLVTAVPTGDVYLELIGKYFICPPTMMFKREVLDQIGGYDETLAYEDFDFWIRSSRNFEYIFNRAPLTKKRIVRNSDSQRQFAFRSKHSYSTFRVCQKIFHLNQTIEEDHALVKRCWYEFRLAAKTFNFSLLSKYFQLIMATKNRI